MFHKMRLHPEPFEKISKGVKKVELRIYDEKRREISIGDEIEFLKRPDFEESIKVKVVGLIIYDNFNHLFDDIPVSLLNYKESDREYLKKSMYEYYSKEDEEK